MENKPRIIRLYSYYASLYEYPCLRIRGKYLEEYGFTIGDQVTITNPSPGRMHVVLTRTNEMLREDLERTQMLMQHLIKAEKPKLGAKP